MSVVVILVYLTFTHVFIAIEQNSYSTQNLHMD